MNGCMHMHTGARGFAAFTQPYCWRTYHKHLRVRCYQPHYVCHSCANSWPWCCPEPPAWCTTRCVPHSLPHKPGTDARAHSQHTCARAPFICTLASFAVWCYDSPLCLPA